MIRGDRVILRPFQRADIAALQRWHDDGEVMRYWDETMPLVVESQWEKDFSPGGKFTRFGAEGFFAICNEEGDAIGRLGFHDYSHRHRHAELSILIGDKEYWGKGYGSDAIIAFGHWYFNQKGAHRLWLTVLATNPRAQRAYEKVGFTREGTWREQVYMDGQWVDEYLYGLLRPEFNARYRPDLARSDL